MHVSLQAHLRWDIGSIWRDISASRHRLTGWTGALLRATLRKRNIRPVIRKLTDNINIIGQFSRDNPSSCSRDQCAMICPDEGCSEGVLRIVGKNSSPPGKFFLLFSYRVSNISNILPEVCWHRSWTTDTFVASEVPHPTRVAP